MDIRKYRENRDRADLRRSIAHPEARQRNRSSQRRRRSTDDIGGPC
jgi:hypothetical protein